MSLQLIIKDLLGSLLGIRLMEKRNFREMRKIIGFHKKLSKSLKIIERSMELVLLKHWSIKCCENLIKFGENENETKLQESKWPVILRLKIYEDRSLNELQYQKMNRQSKFDDWRISWKKQRRIFETTLLERRKTRIDLIMLIILKMH